MQFITASSLIATAYLALGAQALPRPQPTYSVVDVDGGTTSVTVRDSAVNGSDHRDARRDAQQLAIQQRKPYKLILELGGIQCCQRRAHDDRDHGGRASRVYHDARVGDNPKRRFFIGHTGFDQVYGKHLDSRQLDFRTDDTEHIDVHFENSQLGLYQLGPHQLGSHQLRFHQLDLH
ncbi:hypothetical protein LTR53_012867 [Teratosphaeriaceae sp. CCFEE 6253]|nr:hypothetical protein LTR53_012867 [Teratosphaeriaceae sp. CCFEE 6253]